MGRVITAPSLVQSLARLWTKGQELEEPGIKPWLYLSNQKESNHD